MIDGMSGWIFVILGLATFRLTRLLLFDKITEFIRAPFFNEVYELDEEGNELVYIVPKEKGFKRWMGELLSCHWCTGIWASIFLVFLYWWFPSAGEPVIIILAAAAVGSLIEAFIGKMDDN